MKQMISGLHYSIDVFSRSQNHDCWGNHWDPSEQPLWWTPIKCGCHPCLHPLSLSSLVRRNDCECPRQSIWIFYTLFHSMPSLILQVSLLSPSLFGRCWENSARNTSVHHHFNPFSHLYCTSLRFPRTQKSSLSSLYLSKNKLNIIVQHV